MKEAAEVLETLDRRRAATGNPHLGVLIERSLLDQHLKELEADMIADPGCAETKVVVRRDRKA
jgi:hypothetical protein